ncbi:Piwi-domain-containing protein [Pholiota conissans]|uniref:Piwi-domain-containing protein n=1 Tax=Pholiota conissans TaxID=109636 RepID=A0A9P5ZEJ7_9AGAR|nr:Piwi-domain-containing protein [Pholiota conissans]
MDSESQPIQFVSNAFIIEIPVPRVYYLYNEFHPSDLCPPCQEYQLLHDLQESVAPNIFKRRLIYDGEKTAYSPSLLKVQGNGKLEFDVKLRLTVKTVYGSGRKVFRVKLTPTDSPPVSLNDIEDLIYRGRFSPQAAASVNLIQHIIRQTPYHENPTNSFYDAYFTGRGRQAIDNSGLELWRGIRQLVRPAQGKPILTVDTLVETMVKSGLLISVAMDFLKGRQVRDLRLSEKDPKFSLLQRFFKGVRARMKIGHIKLNAKESRIRVISGLVAAAGQCSIEIEDGETITVQEHFFKTYGVRLAYPDIIGVRFKSGRNSPGQIIPAELCYIDEGQQYSPIFSVPEPEPLSKSVARFSSMSPNAFSKTITEAVAAYFRTEHIIESGIRLHWEPMKMVGKILPSPEIKFGQGLKLQVSNGAWNLEGKKFYRPEKMSSWAMVNLCPDRIILSECHRIVEDIIRSCKSLDMDVERPHGIFTGDKFTAERDLNRVMERISQFLENDPVKLARTMLIVLIPSDMQFVRNAIKHWGDIKYGIKTQCLQNDHVLKVPKQYWNSVAMKLNARLGGINWRVDQLLPGMPEFEKQPFIIIGVNVHHHDPDCKASRPSFASLVYSHDTHATQYAALMTVHDKEELDLHPEDVVVNLKELVEEAVDSWIQKHKIAPRNVVLFRNNVADEQYEAIAEQELTAVKAAFETIWAKYKRQEPLPNLAFIVVGRSHHVFFFPTSTNGNCHPGSVIDTDIVHPVYPNFYLQSHAATTQETCRSSHYVVLKDEIFNSTKNDTSVIQNLAYSLCYVSAKSTRSTVIPAPVYYADLVCSRGEIHVPLDIMVGEELFYYRTDIWRKAFKPVNKITGLDKSMYFI